jgi:hypothetical protein
MIEISHVTDKQTLSVANLADIQIAVKVFPPG